MLTNCQISVENRSVALKTSNPRYNQTRHKRNIRHHKIEKVAKFMVLYDLLLINLKSRVASNCNKVMRCRNTDNRDKTKTTFVSETGERLTYNV